MDDRPCNNADVRIRIATLADLEIVASLFDAYRQFYERPSDPDLARAFLHERIRRDESIVLLAERVSGQGVGFCQLYPSFCSLEAAPIYALYDLFIAPSHRRSGAGRSLLLAAEAEAGRRGASRMDLTTARSNLAAQSPYESLGWFAMRSSSDTASGSAWSAEHRRAIHRYHPPSTPIARSPMSNVISPRRIAESLMELWSPRIIGEVDDAFIKVAKVHGSLTWHSHDDEDELFFVLKGELRIELEGRFVQLGEGEMFIVPKGVRHNPVAEEGCHVMLIERKSTLHTGGVVVEKTRSLADQLRPV